MTGQQRTSPQYSQIPFGIELLEESIAYSSGIERRE